MRGITSRPSYLFSGLMVQCEIRRVLDELYWHPLMGHSQL